MLQYGLTWKGMLYTGNAIIHWECHNTLGMPEAGTLQGQGQRGLPSETPFSKQLQSISQPQARHRIIPFLSNSRKGKSTELWRRQQLPRSAELIVSKHSTSLWRTDTISTWETTEHDELHAIGIKLLLKIIMYFLCGRPESYRKHRHRPYPIVLPTAEDKTVLSSDWLLAQ